MLTYGFYDSINGDRKYNAIQISKMFDGLIRDGIFANIGYAFQVVPVENPIDPMTLNVNSGKGWFNHTWIENDSDMPLTLDLGEPILNRIDAIVIDINLSTRTNNIIKIKGTPASSPVRPALINTTSHKQYYLCTVYVAATTTSVTAANIKNERGNSTPFVTGILQTIDLNTLVTQWQAVLDNLVATKTTDVNNMISVKTAEMNTKTAEMNTMISTKKKEVEDFIALLEQTDNEFQTNYQNEFTTWFNNVKGQLNTDVAGNLQNEINTINTKIDDGLADVDKKIETAVQGNLGLKTDLSIYIKTTGSDITGNGTSDLPYASFEKALSIPPKNMNGHIVNIYVAAGTYNEKLDINGFHGGRINVQLLGDITTLGVTVNSSGLLIGSGKSRWTMNNGTVAYKTCFYIANNSNVYIQNTDVYIANPSNLMFTAIECDNSNFTTDGSSNISITKSGIAVKVMNGAKCFINNLIGQQNGTGIYCRYGSTFSYTSKTILNPTQDMDESSCIINSINQTPEAWTEPTTLEGSWVNYGSGYANAGYMKDKLGFVHLKGLVKSGSMVDSIFILPSGYRPTANAIFAVPSNHAFGEIEVQTNGEILQTRGTNDWISLEGITFKV